MKTTIDVADMDAVAIVPAAVATVPAAVVIVPAAVVIVPVAVVVVVEEVVIIVARNVSRIVHRRANRHTNVESDRIILCSPFDNVSFLALFILCVKCTELLYVMSRLGSRSVCSRKCCKNIRLSPT